ncbi:MAG TPA: 5-deoxy-glucuronate isomerase, partial [Pyrinomonadaceae bacterium]|nr:5-deoxy-glucuronate isomerase [Pyrinomonadaceae bacterium]
MTTQTQEAKDKYVFRGTNSQNGRNISITPQNSSMKHLSYGRTILDAETPSVEFNSGNTEIGMICLSGSCSITVDGETNEINQYDSIYIPRDSDVKITTSNAVDLAECS